VLRGIDVGIIAIRFEADDLVSGEKMNASFVGKSNFSHGEACN
jgi:hypothetical protein